MTYHKLLLFRCLNKLSRSLSEVTERILHSRFPPYSQSFAIAGANFAKVEPQDKTDDLFSWNGIVYDGGVPKRKQSLYRQRKRKFNLYEVKPYVRSWHMYEVCEGCGNHHKKYHLCGTCYDQTRYETNKIREHLQSTGEKLSQESVIRYHNEDHINITDGSDGHQADISLKQRKEINMSNRKRPSGWFSSTSWIR